MECAVLLQTNKEVQSRFDNLAQTIMTEEFTTAFTMMNMQTDDDEATRMVSFTPPGDTYIRVIIQHMDNPEMIRDINKLLYPQIVYSIMMRYHLIMDILSEATQGDKLDVPDKDAEFLQYMFVSFWKDNLRFDQTDTIYS